MTEKSANHRAVVEGLEDLKARMESGEVTCAAVRVLRADGSHEDVAVGGTQEERDKLLAKLRAMANPLMH